MIFWFGNGPQIVPNHYLRQKNFTENFFMLNLFTPKNFYAKKIFYAKNIFYTKNFFVPKNFYAEIFLRQIYLHQKFFVWKHFLFEKIFCLKKLFYAKNICTSFCQCHIYIPRLSDGMNFCTEVWTVQTLDPFKNGVILLLVSEWPSVECSQFPIRTRWISPSIRSK